MTQLKLVDVPAEPVDAKPDVIDAAGMRLVPWGWDCIDCGGDYGCNDRCDGCGGRNRIQCYVTEADAARFNKAYEEATR